MIPVCRLTTYKDVPYTFLFMNRIRTPKGKDRDPDSGGSAAGSSHGVLTSRGMPEKSRTT